MIYHELSNEQRRDFIDAVQLFESWRESDREFRHSYGGSMHWSTTGERQYLRRRYGPTAWENLGLRSIETERIKDAYSEQRTKLRQRLTRLNNRIKDREKILRALGLGRVPETAARVLRKLDEVGLLGKQLFVVGTHCLYAYEARSGVLFEPSLMATQDIDLLWDARRKLSIAVLDEVKPEGIIGLLRKVDRSFESKPGHYRAVNDDGFYVDLIRPIRPNEATRSDPKIVDAHHDMAASAIVGLQWLVNAPKFEQVAIGFDGRPVWFGCIDPRVFALHKLWLSKQETREPIKRKRDAAQARAVANVANEYLDMSFSAKDLTALPIGLVKCAKDLAAKSSSPSKGKRSPQR